MFTGIIETIGTLISIEKSNTNINLTFESKITHELKIDQSVAHNGICLTIVNITNNNYTVTAIDETINKTTISNWTTNQEINLERAMKLGDRLDGHIVQGHVDTIGICTNIINKNGSWIFTFEHPKSESFITIEKGSITINGTSLTVINSGLNTFDVAIIPYTFENTIFKNLKINDPVNLEFDVLGKYISKLSAIKKSY